MSNEILTQPSEPLSAMIIRAHDMIVNGEVDPIKAHINVSRMEAFAKAYKANPDIRDITLREFGKYAEHGRNYKIGDCTLQEREVAVKYDYSLCGDKIREELIAQIEALGAQVKEREQFLKNLPLSGVDTVGDNTGEVIRLYPPAKSSTTAIATTFKN